ncbi:MAG: hypothetical protein ABSC89_02795 [Verrucomicrobiota bacterium]
MKKNLIKKLTCLAALGAALAWAGTASAQVTTNLFTFDTSAVGTWVSWQSEWEGYWDNTTDHTGNGLGSLYWYEDTSYHSGVQIFNGFNGNAYWPGNPPYDYIDLSTATNISFWVKWDTTWSTLGINSFNDQDYASTPGWGTSGINVYFYGPSGPNSPFGLVGNARIPLTASNGWALVNVPITPGAYSWENQVQGMEFFKWSNTAPPEAGVFAFWIDDIQAEYPGAVPPEILQNLAPASAQGLNIYDDGNSGDRQSVATVVAGSPDLNYSWKGSANPVTYSIDIAQAPAASYTGYQVHIMIVPGDSITELAPDWTEANALVLFIQRQTNSSVVGNLRYKLNQANNNTWLYGSDTNVFGPNPSHPSTNTIVPTYGGLLGSVTNASGYVGTWSVTIDSSGNITLASPGSTNTCAFPSGDDAAFVSPVTVYWGTQPDNNGFYQDVVLSGVHINGSLNSLNVNLVNASLPSSLVARYSSSSSVFETPVDALYWLQWAPPNPNYVLQSASSLMGPWSNVVGPSVTTTNFVNTFGTSNFIASARNYNPPPMAIAYDFGDDSAPTIDWVSGPTYDAGGSSGSGSVQLKWTWAGGSGNEAFTMDLFASAQNLAGGTLSFDIMIDPSSTAGTNSDYGYFQVIARDSAYNWNPTSLAEGLLTAAGSSVGTWANVSIPLGSGADSLIRALTFQISNDGNISGSQTIYIDNLQLTTSNGSAPILYNINANNSTFITSPMLPSSGAGFFQLVKP